MRLIFFQSSMRRRRDRSLLFYAAMLFKGELRRAALREEPLIMISFIPALFPLQLRRFHRYDVSAEAPHVGYTLEDVNWD